MGTFNFIYTPGPDEGYTPQVIVNFNQTQDWTLDPVVSAFEQFLLGCTYQPGSIAKRIIRE